MFPAFDEPQRLADGRRWTAVFDSYDQRLDNIYYVIAVIGLDGVAQRLVAQVSFFGDDWSVPAFRETIERGLAEVAARGESNTAYLGRV